MLTIRRRSRDLPIVNQLVKHAKRMHISSNETNHFRMKNLYLIAITKKLLNILSGNDKVSYNYRLY